ncbi:MAG: hypothetical protein AAB930_00975 [Patescibacteria group bacterium]
MLKKNGFGLLEIVIAASIVSASLFALVSASHAAFQAVDKSLKQKRAELLAEEGVEAVKILRDSGWAANIDPLTSGTTYYPSFNSQTNTWSLTTTNPGAIDSIFTRTIVFSDVYRRNSDQDIVDISSGDPKTIDSGTLLITSLVTWEGKEAKILTYITNIFQN